MNLRHKNILVTGAAGFVGACLVRRLIAQGASVHVLLRPETDDWRLKAIKDQLTVHQGSLTDRDFVIGMVNAVRPTVIYHLAAHGAYPGQVDAARIMNTNFMGTLNLLQALERIDYQLCVNVGSSSEYGFKSQPMGEADLPVPNSFYAVAKASQTMLCQYIAQAQHKPIVTFRLFSIYGPFEEASRLMPTIIRRCLAGQELVMVPPQTVRDFVFVEDAIDAFLSIDQLLSCGGEIFNICSGKQTRMDEVVNNLFEVTGVQVPVRWNSMPARSWDAQSWVGKTDKAQQRLNWTAKRSLTEGLRATIDWVKYHDAL